MKREAAGSTKESWIYPCLFQTLLLYSAPQEEMIPLRNSPLILLDGEQSLRRNGSSGYLKKGKVQDLPQRI